ncbi:bifunctional DNA primase/polymerase [Gordonia sihwensis]|uniref:bifunctional DNA primase/polymerase n=1 Tax=Gordonia sihwensis TaxID=173559 RepID=UPI0024178453|nr:bifunctional DNA primase/polymerase [Gordonia sihwensis]WFN93871.1 bifunctional DNA primase/polymerase [Gordonia sihwensis]
MSSVALDDLDAAFDDDDEDDYGTDRSASVVDTSTGYGAAAPAYWEKDWRSVLPLPRGKKFPPPTGYTGDGAAVPSYPDVQAWSEDHPQGNLALVMPDGVIGIDVDAYVGKHGAATLAAAEAAWGPLPPTVRSTSRDDAVSGIRLLRVSLGKRLQGQLSMGGRSDVEIVQRHHRYVVAHPSIHPTTGTMYRWLDDDGNDVGIPRVDDLPMLPDRWVQELTAASVPSTAGVTVDVAAILQSMTDGDMDQVVAARLDQAMTDLRSGSGSRHETATRHVMALLRFAEQGRPGVRSALRALGSVFVHAVTVDGSRSEDDAVAEFGRMVTNRGGHALIAASPTLDFDELAEAAEVAGGGVTPPTGPPSPPPPPAGGLDDAFWDSRPSLARIRDAAYGRMVAPAAVLGAVLARAICAVPYTVHLPPLVGGRASLNPFVAMVGESGTGKGASSATADDLVPLGPLIPSVELGSGEGLAHQFCRPAKESEMNYDEVDARGMYWKRRSVLFNASEVDSMAALGTRNAATLDSKIRSAWSGEELGFAYAATDKALTTGSHTYRLGLIVGVQPERAGALLDNAAGGTPQRFVWVSVTDPRISRDRFNPAPIGPLKLPTDWPDEPYAMPVPDVAIDMVLDAHVARQRGDGDALDGHALLCRLKVMAALCVIDGRMEPTDEDWELSGVVMAHSDAVRASVVETLKTADREAAAEKGERSGVEREAAARSEYDTRLDRVCGVILRAVGRLAEAGKPATEGSINRLIAGRDRSMKTDALEALILHGALVRDASTGTFSLAEGAA